MSLGEPEEVAGQVLFQPVAEVDEAGVKSAGASRWCGAYPPRASDRRWRPGRPVR
ncbi:hypothetical protein ACI1MP_01315 [Kitasatospora griseola]|uniref:hypothetical protein n=1 Tax=Kitasatospora griseola TaxID=2064 RepID=UPI003855AA82